MTETPTTPKTHPQAHRHVLLACGSMAMLVLQGTAMSIVLRYSRIRQGVKYVPSVAVAIAEILKLLICVFLQLFGAPGTEFGGARHSLPSSAGPSSPRAGGGIDSLAEVIRGALPMIVPAGMFVFQQILLIWAATFLDAVTYQIFNQAFKLVPTAVFAWLLLGQHLAPVQWASIPVLASGVILVTLNNAPAATPAGTKAVSQANWMLGMVACSVSGLSSAFAGVYFERYVKGKHAAGLIQRNVQLGIFGVPFSVLYAIGRDGAVIRKNGWLAGFGPAAWGVVALQVFGGLVTGMVVKYCDNILKNFSLAVSVILTVLLAIPLFDQWPSPFFLVGVSLVVLSVFMYGKTIDFAATLRWVMTSPLGVLADGGPKSVAAVVLGVLLAGMVVASSSLSGRWQTLVKSEEETL